MRIHVRPCIRFLLGSLRLQLPQSSILIQFFPPPHKPPLLILPSPLMLLLPVFKYLMDSFKMDFLRDAQEMKEKQCFITPLQESLLAALMQLVEEVLVLI